MNGAAVALAAALAAGACAPAGAPIPSHRADRLAAAIASATDLGAIDGAAVVSVRVELVDPSSVDRLRAALGAHGLEVATTLSDHVIEARGTAAAVAGAFGTSLHRYVDALGRPFYASASIPIVPQEIAMLVAHVDPITDHGWIHTARPRAAVPVGGLTPQDLAVAYDFKQLWDMGIDGTGETVVIFGTDGHRQKDLDDYAKAYGLSPFTVTEMFNKNKREAPGEEETMDIEAVHAVAPGARILVYTPTSSRIIDTLPVVEAMLRDNPSGIQTHSWGFCEDVMPPALARQWLDSLQKAASLGATIFFSSGDSGGLECAPDDWSSPPDDDWIGVSAPASVPYAVAVGGTRLSVRQDRSYYNETVWTEPARTVGTGGGISDVYPAGQWQDGPGVRGKEWNGMRVVPDVTMVGDGVSGLATLIGGEPGQGGGTSLGAPVWAGIAALMDQYLKKQGLRPIGVPLPAFYAIAAGDPPFKPAFHDVTVGGNLVHPARPGFDIASGLGSPHVWDLVRDIEALQRRNR